MQVREVVAGRWRIVAVCGDRGDCRLLEFLGSFEEPEDSEARKMMALIRWTAREGPPRNTEKSNPLGDEIFELKTTALRLLYFYDQNQVIVCSHGFVKKSRRCPPGEKAAAVGNRLRYFEAKQSGKLIVRDE